MLDTILLIAIAAGIGYLIYRVETGPGPTEEFRRGIKDAKAHVERQVANAAADFKAHVTDEVAAVKEHIGTVLRHKDMP